MTTLDNANDINTNTTEHKVVKNTLPFDITTDDIEFLAESNAEYAGYIKSDRSIVDEIVPALKRASDGKQSYRGNNAVVQALFESGFLSTRDSDFNTDELFRSVYGIKCVSAIPAYLELHQWLMDNDYTDHIGETEPATLYQHEDSVTCFECDKHFPTEDKDAGCPTCTSVINQKTWNSSGDNYYSAYQFPHELSDSESSVMNITSKRREGNSERPVVFDRVIVIENQSPMWAIILTSNPFNGKPDTMSIVRLKANYNDPCKLGELLELVKRNKFEDNYTWRRYTTTQAHTLITDVKVSDMQCQQVTMPKSIEYALFNIYSGNESK